MEVDIIELRKHKLSESFDAYMKSMIEEERTISEVLKILLEEKPFGIWRECGDIDLQNDTNYALQIKEKENSLELGSWNSKLNFFLIEGENIFIEPENVLIYA